MFSRFKAGCNIAFRPNSEASFLCGYETFACCLINMVITCKWAHYHTCWNHVVVNFPRFIFKLIYAFVYVPIALTSFTGKPSTF